MCQFLKRNKKQYGKLPPKDPESIPWDTLCVDLIGKYQFPPKGGGKKFQILPKGDEKKYKMTTKLEKSVKLQVVTMIDPATGWIEIYTVPSVWRDLELDWLTWYPLPNKVIVDRGNEFLAGIREMIINDYGLTVKPIISRSPQANTILERVHQTIGNILRTFKAQNMVLDDGISASTLFALRATQCTCAQLIFGRNSIIN